MDDEDDVSSSSDVYTPPEMKKVAKKAIQNLLPDKSRIKYQAVYDAFKDWRSTKKAPISENVLLAYFDELKLTNKPNSLWATFSMLKSTLKLNDEIDISKFSKLIAFLKRNSENYTPKKAKVLSNENIEKFISEAPDQFFLAMKVALIFGIMGALRIDELVNIVIENVTEHNGLYLVKIPTSKTKKQKSFTIHDEYFSIVKRFVMLRPQKVSCSNRFFLTYRNGKCTVQPIGKNTLASIPRKIAEYLKLENPQTYTGHSLRRTSATLLAEAGGDLLTIKRHGGWESSKIAESYIEDSIKSKAKTANLISSVIKKPASSHTYSNLNLPACAIEETFTSATHTNLHANSTSNLELSSELISEVQVPLDQNVTNRENINLESDKNLDKNTKIIETPVSQMFIYEDNNIMNLPTVNRQPHQPAQFTFNNCTNFTININK